MVRRLAGAFRGHAAGDDASELVTHVEMQTERLMRRGLDRVEARRQALAESGGITIALENLREQRGLPWLETTAADVRYAVRALLRSPAYATVAVITLAIGIGANAALFSVVNDVLLRPLPYRAPDALVSLLSSARGSTMAVSVPDFMDWRAQSTAFAGLTASYTSETILTGSGEPVKLSQSRVSANFFDVVGVRPIIGRGFTADEENAAAPRVALVGERLWRTRFGADTGIVGRTLVLDGFPTTVIGVTPAYVSWPQRSDIWMTTRFSERDLSPRSRGARWITVLGRVRNESSVEQANAEVNAISRRLALADSAHNYGVSAVATPLLERMTQTLREPLFVLLGAVGLVLLVCCANVASLSLSRVASRQTELAVRKALGASRSRIIRQALTEHLVVSACGGIAGVLLAIAGVRALVAISPASLPRIDDVSVSGSVLAFSAGVTFLAGLLFGVMPALLAGAGPARLREGARGASARAPLTRKILVVAETALAIVLVAGAGLLLRSFAQLSRVNPGFDPRDLTTFGVALPSTRYASEDQMRAFNRALMDDLRRIPGVAAAGVSFSLPLSGDGFGLTFDIDGRIPDPKNEPRAQVRVADPAYFSAMRIPLLRGRMFDARDRAGAEPAILISAEAVKRFFGDEDPIGKRVDTGWGQGGNTRFGGVIVGVIGDVRQFGLDGKMTPHLYMSYEQWPLNEYSVVVRSGSGTNTLLPPIRSALKSIDADIPVIDPRTYAEVVDASFGNRTFYLKLLGLFAVVALVLAAIGTYGVIAYDVQLRRREVGIRLALGATAAGIVAMILREGAGLLAAGVVIGLTMSLAAARVLDSLLFGVGHHDVISMAGAPLVLLLTGTLACVVPASRAGRLNPVETIRES